MHALLARLLPVAGGQGADVVGRVVGDVGALHAHAVVLVDRLAADDCMDREMVDS